MEWVVSNGWILWFALALVLAAIEAATVDLVFLMLAGGAVAAGLVAILGVSFTLEVITAVIVATALLGIVRPMVKSRLGSPDAPKVGIDAYLGRTAEVVETVSSRDGRVKLSGEIWSARVTDHDTTLAPGRRVEVVAVRGAQVIVVPVEPTGDASSQGV